jgi:hypothetical protein
MAKFIVWNKKADRQATVEEIQDLKDMEDFFVWMQGDHCTLEVGDDGFEIRDYSPSEKVEK